MGSIFTHTLLLGLQSSRGRFLCDNREEWFYRTLLLPIRVGRTPPLLIQGWQQTEQTENTLSTWGWPLREEVRRAAAFSILNPVREPYFQHGISHALHRFVVRNGYEIKHILVSNMTSICIAMHIHRPLTTRITPHTHESLFRLVGMARSNILALEMVPVLREGEIHIETVVRALHSKEGMKDVPFSVGVCVNVLFCRLGLVLGSA